MINVAVFILGSVINILISRKSLRQPGSHGYYRFFAWEVMLALAILNIPVWFKDPFSAFQIIAWTLLMISLVMLGFGLKLVSAGKPDNKRQDEALLGFEKTSVLVTTGIYGYIRHPLYSSLLFLAWGIFFKDVNGYTLMLVLAATAFLMATAKADEKECLAHFGPAYQEYMKKTKMFVPFVY